MLNHTYQLTPHFLRQPRKKYFLEHNSYKIGMSAVATNTVVFYLCTFHNTNKLTNLLCPNRNMQPADNEAATQGPNLGQQMLSISWLNPSQVDVGTWK